MPFSVQLAHRTAGLTDPPDTGIRPLIPTRSRPRSITHPGLIAGCVITRRGCRAGPSLGRRPRRCAGPRAGMSARAPRFHRILRCHLFHQPRPPGPRLRTGRSLLRACCGRACPVVATDRRRTDLRLQHDRLAWSCERRMLRRTAPPVRQVCAPGFRGLASVGPSPMAPSSPRLLRALYAKGVRFRAGLRLPPTCRRRARRPSG